MTARGGFYGPILAPFKSGRKAPSAAALRPPPNGYGMTGSHTALGCAPPRKTVMVAFW